MDTRAHADITRGRADPPTDPYAKTDWKAEIESRWQALGRKIFVVGPQRPLALREVLEECSTLAIVWTLVQTKGNFTSAASLLRTSRKAVRRTFHAWRRDNPTLVPMPFVLFLRWSELHGGDDR